MFNWLLSLFGAGKKSEPTTEAPYKLEPPTLDAVPPPPPPVNAQPTEGWPFPKAPPAEGKSKRQHNNRQRNKPKSAPVAKQAEPAVAVEQKKRTFKKRPPAKKKPV